VVALLLGVDQLTDPLRRVIPLLLGNVIHRRLRIRPAATAPGSNQVLACRC
jgi:hypothetical protein